MGYSLVPNTRREISNCDGCKEESIDIDGGAYALFGLGYKKTKLEYFTYFSGDFSSSIRLSFNF